MARERNPELNFVSNIFKLEPELMKIMENFAEMRRMSMADVVRFLILKAIADDFDPKIAEKTEVEGIQVRLSKEFEELLMSQVRRFKTTKQGYFEKVAERYLDGKDSK